MEAVNLTFSFNQILVTFASLVGIGISALWTVAIYIIKKYDGRLDDMERKSADRHKHLHEKFDGKHDAMRESLSGTSNLIHKRISDVENNCRDDVRHANKRVDDLLKK